MNLNRLISMILRPIINRGINAGIDAVARRKGGAAKPDTPEAQKAARDQSRRAKETMRATRRITRM